MSFMELSSFMARVFLLGILLDIYIQVYMFSKFCSTFLCCLVLIEADLEQSVK